MIDLAQEPLAGKKGLVLGIANEHFIAYGCTKALWAVGAELVVGYLDEKAKPFAEPLAKELEAALFLACDVRDPGQLHGVFQAVSDLWGNIDFALLGPVKARAASGIDHFDDLLARRRTRTDKTSR
jgi:enoyl-[acyl-carrier protein] reductase I